MVPSGFRFEWLKATRFGKLVLETFVVSPAPRKYRIDPWQYGAYNLMLLALQSISCLPVTKDAPPQLAASSRSPLFRRSKSFAPCSTSDHRFGVAQHEPRPIVIRDNPSRREVNRIPAAQQGAAAQFRAHSSHAAPLPQWRPV
jgi:hypothetical protein